MIDTLRGTGRCLLIDEAHQLKHEAFELLRDIHDEAGVPIILAGTVKLHDAVNDHDLFFGQMSSRIALRYNVTESLSPGSNSPGGELLHSVAEIGQIYERDGVCLTRDGRVFLARLANLPGLGGLRLCAKLVQVARAAGSGEDAIDAGLLIKVVHAMNDQAFARHTLEYKAAVRVQTVSCEAGIRRVGQFESLGSVQAHFEWEALFSRNLTDSRAISRQLAPGQTGQEITVGVRPGLPAHSSPALR